VFTLYSSRDIAKFFWGLKGCKFTEAPVKSVDSCRVTLLSEFQNEKFPKSAQSTDLIRCSATFETLSDLSDGLLQFEEFVNNNKEKFTKIARIKNGFNIPSGRRGFGKEGQLFGCSKKMRLAIPDTYSAIKFDLIYSIDDDKEPNENGNNTTVPSKKSMICQVQFLWKAIVKSNKKQEKLLNLIAQKSFLTECHRQMQINSFDFDLKLAGFAHQLLAPLIIHFPLEFARSSYIREQKDSDNKNYLCQMAYNGNVKYQCAKEIMELLPPELVESQLCDSDRENTLPLMYALWKQSTMECIRLFIPANLDSSLWSQTTQVLLCLISHKQSFFGTGFGYHALIYAVRNEHVPTKDILELAKKHISEERWQELILSPERWVIFQNFTPIHFAFFVQDEVGEELMQYIIPIDFRTNFTFWESTTNFNHVCYFFFPCVCVVNILYLFVVYMFV
ncbi:hypothetical protein RFI_26463, partial [Reticulomyxa filosa]